MKKITIILLSLLSMQLFAQTQLDEIVTKFDDLYKSTSSYAKIRMEIITPHWQRNLEMKSWSLGSEKSLIKIISPKKEKGVGSLKLDQEMWNYLPKTNKVIKIPPSMMMSSWMGSDFTNDDLVKEYTLQEDYTLEIVQPENGDKNLVYLKCTPKEGRAIIWGHLLISVRKEDYLPVKQQYYDENGKLIREMNFKNIKTFDGKKIPAVMELIPMTKDGHKTIVEYLEADFDIDLDQSYFSLRNLRKGL